MQQPRQTQTRGTRRPPWASRPPGAPRPGRRAVSRSTPFARGRGGRATTRGFGPIGPTRSAGRGAAAGRGKQPSGNSVMTLGRGLLGKQKQSNSSRKGPALLAVVAGLGAAGAAALKRRRSGEDQPAGHVPPPDPVGEPTIATEATPPPPGGSA